MITGLLGLVTSVLMESLLLLSPSFFQVKALIQTPTTTSVPDLTPVTSAMPVTAVTRWAWARAGRCGEHTKYMLEAVRVAVWYGTLAWPC